MPQTAGGRQPPLGFPDHVPRAPARRRRRDSSRVRHGCGGQEAGRGHRQTERHAGAAAARRRALSRHCGADRHAGLRMEYGNRRALHRPGPDEPFRGRLRRAGDSARLGRGRRAARRGSAPAERLHQRRADPELHGNDGPVQDAGKQLHLVQGGPDLPVRHGGQAPSATSARSTTWTTPPVPCSRSSTARNSTC